MSFYRGMPGYFMTQAEIDALGDPTAVTKVQYSSSFGVWQVVPNYDSEFWNTHPDAILPYGYYYWSGADRGIHYAGN